MTSAIALDLVQSPQPPNRILAVVTSAPTTASVPCILCDQPVFAVHVAPDPRACCVAILPDGSVHWVHISCRLLVKGEHITSMATPQTTRDLPDCRMCGMEYALHIQPITSIWAAYCNIDGTPYYRPSKPFRERNWPHDWFIDSPMYTDDCVRTAAQLETANA